MGYRRSELVVEIGTVIGDGRIIYHSRLAQAQNHLTHLVVSKTVQNPTEITAA